MDHSASALPSGVIIRELTSHEDRRQCVSLQEVTWGKGFDDIMPPRILQIGSKMGGISAGAFDASNRMLAFVFGLTGLRHGELAHWSDMLAVVPELRNSGLGAQLKEYQRARCEQMGIRVIYWSWDPLVSRNSHLNLNKLGVRVDEFAENLYGALDSPMFGGLPTDRFIAAWDLDPQAVSRRLAQRTADTPLLASAPIVAGGPDAPPPTTWPDAPAVRVNVPRDFQGLLVTDPAAAAAYRRHSHDAFTYYFGMHYEVSSFHPSPGDDGTFLLTEPSA